MSGFALFLVALVLAIAISDLLLTSRIRKATEYNRLDFPGADSIRFGGNPLGILTNLFRMRSIPAVNDLSDPDHKFILLHYRAHLMLVVILAVCVVGIVALRIAA